MKNKSKIGYSLLICIIIQLMIFILFGVLEEMSIFLGIIFFLLIPTNVVLFIIYIGEKIIENKKIKTKKKSEIKRKIIKTYILEFPYKGIIENELPKDDEYISGKEVYLYLGQENIDGINMSWNGSNMQDFIDDKKIKNKVADMNLSLKNNGICYIYIRTYEELTKEDKEYLLNYVKGQASDGWGEGDFDYIYDKNNKEIYFYWDCQEKAREETCIPFAISFWWNSNDWYIRYVEDDK